MVTFHASVNYTGRTSMEIGIKVISEDIRSHYENTNVAILLWLLLMKMETSTCSKLELVTEDDKRRYNDA